MNRSIRPGPLDVKRVVPDRDLRPAAARLSSPALLLTPLTPYEESYCDVRSPDWKQSPT